MMELSHAMHVALATNRVLLVSEREAWNLADRVTCGEGPPNYSLPTWVARTRPPPWPRATGPSLRRRISVHHGALRAARAGTRRWSCYFEQPSSCAGRGVEHSRATQWLDPAADLQARPRPAPAAGEASDGETMPQLTQTRASCRADRTPLARRRACFTRGGPSSPKCASCSVQRALF